jgi:CPA1 family monovalent cation:H+ antiporter
LDAIRRQYPDYVVALEVRFLRQSALRQEMGRYQALFEDGLIPRELYDDLKRGVANARTSELRPRFDIGLDTRRLVERLDILSSLSEPQLDRVAKLLRPRFTVPDELIIRAGDRAHECFFIASGAVEVLQRARRIRLGSGEFFGELALLTGRRRQADVVALTYCQLLVLRRADFQHFLSAHPEAQASINRVALARLAMNQNATDTGDLPPKAA